MRILHIIMGFAALTALAACAGPRSYAPAKSVSGISGSPISNISNFQRFAGQGQFIQPLNLAPTLTPRLPQDDTCRSRLYLTLVGQHEGAIFLAGLPGRRRLVKPALLEDFDMADNDFIPPPPLVEVIDFLPQQSIYAGSIRTITDRFLLSDDDPNRLTLELDPEGYVQEVRCG